MEEKDQNTVDQSWGLGQMASAGQVNIESKQSIIDQSENIKQQSNVDISKPDNIQEVSQSQSSIPTILASDDEKKPKPDQQPSPLSETNTTVDEPMVYKNISDQQPLNDILSHKKTKNPIYKDIIWMVLVFLGSFIFIYLFLTFPAQYEKVKYFIKNISKSEQSKTIITQDAGGTDLFFSTINEALEKAPDKSQEIANNFSIDISNIQDNHLIIPKIDIKAPIIWQVAPNEKLMQSKLQEGLVHFNGTALPNENKGNVFVSGHSSYYWWDKGKYKTVFANLDKLENGDEVALAYQGNIYIYEVFEKVTVNPKQTEVLAQTPEPILSLMTCVPVGTNLKRLIVKLERLGIVNKDSLSSKIDVKADQTTEEILPFESEDKPKESTEPIIEKPQINITIPEKNPLELLPWVN